MESKQAMKEAVNAAFPTIITSGSIMVAASFLIGGVVKNPLIATLGNCLGRGVIISILGVLLVIPSMLVIFDKPLMKTFFRKRERKKIFKRLPLVIGNAAAGGQQEAEDKQSDEN